MVETHSACALYHRFKNQGCEFFVVVCDYPLKRLEVGTVPFLPRFNGGSGSEESYWESGTEGTVHTCHRVAYAHGIPCVAVISAAYGHKICASMVACLWYRSLYSHLHCHFHSHRSGIGIEYVVHGWRGYLQKHFTKLYGWLVGEPAKHYVAHFFNLGDGSSIYARVVVAVDHAPPWWHAVDQFASVGKAYPYSVRAINFISGERVDGGCIWVPQVFPVECVEKCFHCFGFNFRKLQLKYIGVSVVMGLWKTDYKYSVFL